MGDAKVIKYVNVRLNEAIHREMRIQAAIHGMTIQSLGETFIRKGLDDLRNLNVNLEEILDEIKKADDEERLEVAV